MDPNQVQLTARELLERHIAETEAPARPEKINYAELREERAGYSYGRMDVQQPSANLTNNRINAEYLEHERQGEERRGEQREDVNKAREGTEQNVDRSSSEEHISSRDALLRHMEKSSEPPGPPTQEEHTLTAREALLQHIENASREVTGPTIDPFARDHSLQRSGYER